MSQGLEKYIKSFKVCLNSARFKAAVPVGPIGPGLPWAHLGPLDPGLPWANGPGPIGPGLDPFGPIDPIRPGAHRIHILGYRGVGVLGYGGVGVG